MHILNLQAVTPRRAWLDTALQGLRETQATILSLGRARNVTPVAGPNLLRGANLAGEKQGEKSRFLRLTPVAGLIFETKNRAIFLERFFGREITAREQLSRAVILARF